MKKTNENKYEPLISTLCMRILQLIHNAHYINLLLEKELKDPTKDVFHGSSLALGDWTDPAAVQEEDLKLGDKVFPAGTNWKKFYGIRASVIFDHGS